MSHDTKRAVACIALVVCIAGLVGTFLPVGVTPAARPMGYTPDPQATAAFVASLDKPFLAQAGPDLLKHSQDENPVFLYQALQKAYKQKYGSEWVVGAQGIGDCVSWGNAHACDLNLAVMFVRGEVSDFKMAATESIYGGSRVEGVGGREGSGGWGDGSYGAAAASWLNKYGVIYREAYPDFGQDLTTYAASKAKNWGNWGNGGQGDGGKFDEVAKLHNVKGCVLVRSFREAAAAIQAGYPVAVCSGQGFASTRDNDGFARASGSWSHCMCFSAVRFDKPGLLCQNSWGPNWISGPKWPADQPDGSFWVDERVAERMLSGGDSFAISNIEGFPYRDLQHGDWASLPPRGASKSGEVSFALAP